MNPDPCSLLMNSWRLQLRSVRGQLASSTSACSAAEGRNRQLSSQVSNKIAELAQLREEAEKAASNYKAVCLLLPRFATSHGMTEQEYASPVSLKAASERAIVCTQPDFFDKQREKTSLPS